MAALYRLTPSRGSTRENGWSSDRLGHALAGIPNVIPRLNGTGPAAEIEHYGDFPPKGPKRKLKYRLDTPIRAATAALAAGATQLSAGSRTDPGGYTGEKPSGKQFSLADSRSVREVRRWLERLGYRLRAS